MPLLFFFFFFYESSVWLLVRGSPSLEAALWKCDAARRRARNGQVTPRLCGAHLEVQCARIQLLHIRFHNEFDERKEPRTGLSSVNHVLLLLLL